MDISKSNEVYDAVNEFKEKHIKILSQWYQLVADTKDQLFKNYCLKDYLKECEPWQCNFSLTNKCQYSDALQKLDSITKILL